MLPARLRHLDGHVRLHEAVHLAHEQLVLVALGAQAFAGIKRLASIKTPSLRMATRCAPATGSSRDADPTASTTLAFEDQRRPGDLDSRRM